MYLYRMVLSYVNIQLDFVRYMLMRGVAAGHSFLLLHSILLCDLSSFFLLIAGLFPGWSGGFLV